jgi:hypothetical protein
LSISARRLRNLIKRRPRSDTGWSAIEEEEEEEEEDMRKVLGAVCECNREQVIGKR